MDSERVSDRLVDCEQKLASVPEFELRLEQALAENVALRSELESTRSSLHDVTTSTSWRLTEPLRLLQRLRRRS